ncbi:MAG TPA: hypothetical protein VM840_13550 [Actinomycetota bacterium]|nr:hypothetical protein [Actinomycetota bacterium]
MGNLPSLIADLTDMPVEHERLQQEAERLMDSGEIVELPDGRLKLSEECRTSLNDEVRVVEANEADVHQRFVTCLRSHQPDADVDSTWRAFNDEFLVPLIKDLGARTFELLAPGGPQAGELKGFQSLMEPLARRFGEPFRDAALAFLDPASAEVRQYLLRRLDAFFATQAESLDDATLGAIGAARGGTPELRVFLDTNFVFSMLNLHDNPSNEVASRLTELIGQISSHVRVKLYVLPITIEEARRVLSAQIYNLEGIRVGGALARAAVSLPMSGLATRYLEEASRSKSWLSPQDFFGPFEQNLVPILKEHGVEVFNDPAIEGLRTEQAVLDDLLTEQEAQQARPQGAKPYETNLHDMVLWHFVRSRRPQVLESPLDAGLWILTLDFGLIRFDRRKAQRGDLPSCVAPAILMQLLQFWVPRNANLEAAIVASMRLPLLFARFDPEAERVSIRILRRLSRYEDIGDLSSETISHVLTNEALRQRIGQGVSEAEEEALVEKAFIEETQRLEDDLQQERRVLQQERAAAGDREKELADAADQASQQVASLREELQQATTRAEALDETLASTRQQGRVLESELGNVQREVRELQIERNRRRYATRTLLALGVAVVGTLAVGELMSAIQLEAALSRVIAVASGVVLWIISSSVAVKGEWVLGDWWFARMFVQAKGLLVRGLGGIVLGVAATALYELLWGG